MRGGKGWALNWQTANNYGDQSNDPSKAVIRKDLIAEHATANMASN